MIITFQNHQVPGGFMQYTWRGGGGGCDGASYFEPKEYTRLKYYTQINTRHQTFSSSKKYKSWHFNTDLFNQTDFIT